MFGIPEDVAEQVAKMVQQIINTQGRQAVALERIADALERVGTDFKEPAQG